MLYFFLPRMGQTKTMGNYICHHCIPHVFQPPKYHRVALIFAVNTAVAAVLVPAQGGGGAQRSEDLGDAEAGLGGDLAGLDRG
jgi:hypothetical protein